MTSRQPKPRIPRIAGEWRRIYSSEIPLNDFCFFRDHENTWHVIGIESSGTSGDAWRDECTFFHATGRSLDRPFLKQPSLFAGMPEWIGPARSANDRVAKHAPFVIRHDGLYHMFYRRPPGTCLVVRTPDPFAWPNRVELAFEEADARDCCIIRVEDRFLMYCCQAATPPGGGEPVDSVVLRESPDLRTWSAPAVAWHNGKPSQHSRAESPFVLRRAEGFCLFLRDRTVADACLVPVFFSPDPTHFPSGGAAPLTVLRDAHAPEIAEADGRTWIARVSGCRHANASAPERSGWVEVAELAFDA